MGDGKRAVEGRAVNWYMDDEEWEARERREGRHAVIAPFPYFGNGFNATAGSSSSRPSGTKLFGLPSGW